MTLDGFKKTPSCHDSEEGCFLVSAYKPLNTFNQINHSLNGDHRNSNLKQHTYMIKRFREPLLSNRYKINEKQHDGPAIFNMVITCLPWTTLTQVT